MGAKISFIKSYLPKNILSNEHLANDFGRWESEKIEKKLGIRQRHIAAEGETAGDMAYYAAEKVLENYDRNKIGMVILCTQSPDYFLPTTACILQNRLNLRTSIGAFDFNLGCSGYIYGLAIAKSFIYANIASSILLITSETYSKHINQQDLANKTIFGDAATATIVEKTEISKIFEFVLGTDGKGKNNLIVPNGCFRTPFDSNPKQKISASGDVFTDNNLFMNGPEIFNFTIDAVPQVVKQCLHKNDLTIEEVNYVIFHQANKFMIDYLRKKIGIPKEKFYSNMLLTGNTVSSTIPLAIEDSLKNGPLKEKDKVLLCGFGVGYSWGAVIIEV